MVLMNTKTYISIIAILAGSSSILLSQESVYTFPFENSYKLPPLHSRIKMEEISSTYQTWGNMFTTEITGYGDEPLEQTSYSFISDAKVVDAVRFLEFYMEEQLLEPGLNMHGNVEMGIIYYNENLRFNAGSVFGILTLGIGTLCGVPFATNVTDVEVEATFFDMDELSIANHRGVGRGKKAMSIYTSSTRKAHQKALLDALEDLNEHVMSDPVLKSL
jgi:hypothetical protein